MALHVLVQTLHPLSGATEAVVIRTMGDLDAAGLDSFDAAVDEAVDLACRLVVVDLSELDFLGISGAAALSHAWARAAAGAVEILVVVGSPWVDRTLRVTGVAPFLRRFGSLGAALAAVRDDAPDRAM